MFKDLKLRRQHRIGQYIVDFYCHSKRIVIELDGSHHAGPKQDKYEHERTEYLRSKNLRVLRYWNGEVLNNKERVLEDIRNCLSEQVL